MLNFARKHEGADTFTLQATLRLLARAIVVQEAGDAPSAPGEIVEHQRPGKSQRPTRAGKTRGRACFVTGLPAPGPFPQTTHCSSSVPERGLCTSLEWRSRTFLQGWVPLGGGQRSGEPGSLPCARAHVQARHAQ